MLNMFIALLLEKGIITEHEALGLVDELKYATFPGDFASAHQSMKKILAKIERDI